MTVTLTLELEDTHSPNFYENEFIVKWKVIDHDFPTPDLSALPDLDIVRNVILPITFRPVMKPSIEWSSS